MTQDKDRRLPEAYERMLERSANLLNDVKKTASTLQQALEQAKNKAVELGELTAEEAAQIAHSVQQDLHDIACNFAEQERDFTDWLRLDILLIEKQLQKRVSSLAEVARQEIMHATRELDHPLEWHTGEVTGIGVLVCKSCGKKIHFNQAGHIPPCPQCKGSHFHRSWGE